jgi:two-component system, sensor histidine kinase
LHVLVAEDHPVNRQYMATLLETLGHVAQFANNGQEAVAAATQRSFDVVLMDVHMPLMDGVAATRAIRALPDAARSTVPIVALTADAFDDTRDRCIVAGMNDFLTKPVSPDKLTASLRRLFGHPSPLAPCGSASGVPATRDTPSTTVLDEGAITMVLQTLTRAQYQAMVQTYLDQAPQTVQRLRSAVRDAQPLELRVNAHAAKGAALNLGLAGLAATAEALQLGAAHLPAHEIVRLVQRYEELVPTTRDALVGMGFFETEPVNSSA